MAVLVNLVTRMQVLMKGLLFNIASLTGLRKVAFRVGGLLLIIGITLLFMPFVEAYNGAVTAIATCFIAWFTLTLWQSNEKMWDVTKVTANAAKQSADAAVAIERARFYVVISPDTFLECVNAAERWHGPTELENRPLPMDIHPKATISFKNYGKTPGFVLDVGTGLIYSEIAPDPVYDVQVVNENIVGGGNLTEGFATLIRGQMTMRMAQMVRSGRASILVYGYIYYADVFGNTQRHNFLQRFARLHQFRYILQSCDYKHYNIST